MVVLTDGGLGIARKTERYRVEMRELLLNCGGLAAANELSVTVSQTYLWPEAYVDPDYVAPNSAIPSDGPIFFRQEDSKLVAILEVKPHFSHDSKAITGIEKLTLTVLDRAYKRFAQGLSGIYGSEPEFFFIRQLYEMRLE